MFREVYEKIELGSPNWAELKAPEGKLYPWDTTSTYIKSPPFFEDMTKVRINNFVMQQELTLFNLSFREAFHNVIGKPGLTN